MLKLYLDTSAFIKRFLIEPGSDCIDLVFTEAEAGDLVLTISVWNIGEALGVFDQRRRRDLLSQSEFEQVQGAMGEQLLRLIRLRSMEIKPVESHLLTRTWDLIKTHHLYQADALQIATCMENKNDALVSGDEALVKASEKEGLNAIYLPDDEKELTSLISKH